MKSTTARRIAALTLALSTPLALAACSGSNSTAPSGTTTAATSSSASLGDLKPGGAVDKAKFFEVTKAAAAANTTYAFTTQVGEGGSDMSSTGVVDNTDPNNRKRQITLKDDKGESQLVIAGGQVYMKNANLLGGKWLQSPVNPALAEVLGGASDRIQADQGLVQAITYVGEEDVSGTKARHFTLTVDPTKATAAPSAGSATASGAATTSAAATASGAATTSGAAGTTTVEYWLDDKNRTRKMKHSVAGVPTVTTYDKWGEPVTITVPSPDQVTSTAAPSGTPASPAPSASAS
ncbi:MAG: hypothetical protein IPK37_01040 [Austwickia sp.]|jgi:hypothetical protein|nr:MAG: hypothetical protein IPK37_01040 [Austwickia sp.]